MAIQTRGQITLLSKPDITISMTPELITIPVNNNGELIDSLSFTETITIQAKDSKGRALYFESVSIDESGTSKDWRSQEELVKEGILEIIQEVPGDKTSQIIGYKYYFKRTKEQVNKELGSTGFINFGFKMENKLDIAEDDFSDYRTISYIKTRSGQDGTPAYSVDIAAEQQVFIRTINPDGTYSYEPETITLMAVPINFEESSFEPYYKWFKYGAEGNYLQQGQGENADKLEIFPDRNGYGVGVYVCEIYRSFSGEIEDSPIARDYASIGMATNGIDNYTVSLTNDNAVVTVDNLQYALEDGTVSTGIVVYKGANKISPNDYSIEIENEKDGEVEFSAILNIEDPDNSFWEVQASYKKGRYVGAIGEFIIKVGGMDFKKRFQVSPSLMGKTSRLIKISGQQYFRINQDGNSYTPNDITLTAHLSNVEFLRWEYQNPQNKEEWLALSDASLSLDVDFNNIYWQEDNIAKFRAVATAENILYYDEYTIYKFKEGQNSINVIASNESVNIITDVFGKIDPSIDNTIETIYFTVFNGSDASTDITIPMDKIEIIPDVSSMISVSSQSNILRIGITRDDNKVFTPATIKVALSNGATKTISLVPLQQGLSARTLTIYGNQVFKYSNSTTGEITYNPSQITVHAQHQNIEGYSWYYRIGGEEINQDLLVPGDSYTFSPSDFSGWSPNQILTIGVKEKNPPTDSTAIADEITIHQVYDGSNGKDSSLVFLNNPSITITEDSEGKLVGETFECEVLGITGNENVTPTGISWGDKPNWMSITLNETKLQLEVSDDVPTSDIQNRQGFITVYTISPINVSMQLHWTIVKNGKDGQNGIDYALTPSQAVLRKDANSGISPSELTFSATIKEGSGLAKPLIGYIECYSSTDGENFSSNPIKASTDSSLTILADAGWAAIKGKLYEDSSKEVLLDEQTVIVIESSSASFVASLDNEYIPIVCDADGNILNNDGNLGTCKITAYLNGVEITDYSTNLSVSTEEGSISYVGPDSDGQITIRSLTSDKAKIKFTVAQTINNTPTEIDKYLKIEKIKSGKDAPETETLIHYQASDNGTSVPNGTWHSSISTTGIQQGQFLWTRTTLHYKNGEKEDIISYSVSRYGLDGEPGKTMTRVENYYAASTSSSVAPTSGWKTDPMETTFSSVNKYLWNYEEIYSNNTLLSTTDPTVISVYGDTGATIASITETYKASKSDQYYSYPGYSYTPNFVSTVADSGFNSVYKYLWNIEKFYDKDGNLLAESPARVIGVYGNDGKTVSSIVKYYKLGTLNYPNGVTNLNQITSISDWDTSIPTLKKITDYIWSLDYITYNDGSTLITNVKLDAGARSDKFAENMYKGTFTLNMLAGTTTKATLNYQEGLYIANSKGYSLQANAQSLGIYEGETNLQFGVYTEGTTTSLLLKGTIYADKGKIGTLEKDGVGWTIQGSNGTTPAAIYSGSRNSLGSSAEGVYIGTDGISLASNKSESSFTYDVKEGALTIEGNIIATSLEVKKGAKISSLVIDESETSIANLAGIYKSTSENYFSNSIGNNGDLGIFYSPTSQTVTPTVTGGTTAVFISSDSSAPYYGTSTPASTNIRCGLTSVPRWNLYRNSSGDAARSTDYIRVGKGYSAFGASPNISCGLHKVFNNITTSVSTLEKITINFTYNTNPEGKGIDGINAKNPPAGNIIVALYNNSNTEIARGSFSLTGKSFENSDKAGTVELIKNSGVVLGGSNVTYQVVFYSTTSGALFCIRHNSIKIPEKLNSVAYSENKKIFIKTNGSWHEISGTSSGSGNQIPNNWTWTSATNSLTAILSGTNGLSVNIPTIPPASSKYGVVKTTSTVTDSTGLTACPIIDGVPFYKAGTVYSAGNGISISDASISVSDSIYGYGANNSRKAITFQSGGAPSGGKNGDICFVY